MPATLADIQAKYGDSVYPLYKDEMHAPYMERIEGVGYQGVVLYDENQDKIQCTECGKWVRQITNTHLKSHGYRDAKEYKKKNGLYNKTPLCTPKISEVRRVTCEKNQLNENFKSASIRRVSRIKDILPEVRSQKMQYKNERGLCDAQIASRLIIVRDMAEKTSVKFVSATDIKKYDIGLWSHIRERYGNLEFAINSLGLGHNANEIYDDSSIIARLRKFVVDHKRIPVAKEMKKPTAQTIFKYFGSWERAKMMAGLDQLLQEVK